MRKFWRNVREMKRWEDLDEESTKTVEVGVTMGFCVGLLALACPVTCVVAIVIAVVTQ